MDQHPNNGSTGARIHHEADNVGKAFPAFGPLRYHYCNSSGSCNRMTMLTSSNFSLSSSALVAAGLWWWILVLTLDDMTLIAPINYSGDMYGIIRRLCHRFSCSMPFGTGISGRNLNVADPKILERITDIQILVRYSCFST